MSKIINDKTNISLKVIASLSASLCGSVLPTGEKLDLHITLSANGQLITGIITSKESFLEAEENSL